MKKEFAIVIALIVAFVAALIVHEKNADKNYEDNLVDAGSSIEDCIYLDLPDEFLDKYEYYTLETDTVEPSEIDVDNKEDGTTCFNIDILTYNGSYLYSEELDSADSGVTLKDFIPDKNTDDYYLYDTLNVDGRDIIIIGEKIDSDDFDTGFWGSLSGYPDADVVETTTYVAFFEDDTHIYQVGISLNCYAEEPLTDELKEDFMTLVRSIRFKT